MRPTHLALILEREFAAATEGLHTPVMLWGPPGVGKSELVRGVASRAGVGLIDLRLSQLEPTDLRGIPFRDGARVEWSVPSTLPDASRHGPRGILYEDRGGLTFGSVLYEVQLCEILWSACFARRLCAQVRAIAMCDCSDLAPPFVGAPRCLGACARHRVLGGLSARAGK